MNLTALGQMTQFNGIAYDEFCSVLDAIDQAILITDCQGVVLFYNDSHARMDGLKKEDVIGHKVTEIYELDENTSLVMQSIRSREPIINHLTIFKARNGRVVNSVINVKPLFHSNEITGFVSCVNDWQYLDGLRNPEEAIKETNKWTKDKGYTFEDIIGSNQRLLSVINRARLAANSSSPILIYGKTGTGKELIAQSIHNQSNRKNNPYLAINCAAIPENLLESILFGSTRGAFTGAVDKKGLLEQVDGGTLLLDEINSMAYPLQAKILRVLQEKKVSRIGELKEKRLDIKVISSINIHPGEAMDRKQLRQDLLYRLGVVYLELPDLCDRLDDLPLLVDYFIAKFNRRMKKNVQSISEQVLAHFTNYHWPGNIRELENLIESAMNMIGIEFIIQPWHLSAYSAWTPDHVPKSPDPDSSRDKPRAEERGLLIKTLTLCSGNMTQAARTLKISRNTLYKRLDQYQLDPKEIARNTALLQIEEALHSHHGNITQAAGSLKITRQALTYKIKKLNLVPRHYKK